MKKKQGIAILVLAALITGLLAFTTAVGWGSAHIGAAKNINLGLDLSGGVSITYQAKGDTPSAEDMSDTIYKLQQRVAQYSTEAQVYKEGDNRINIEIPGVSDANTILQDLGQPGTLYFICQKGSDGTDNYTYDSASQSYILSKSIDELEADGCLVLSGTDVKDAQAAQQTDQTTQVNENIVELSFTAEGATKFADATTTAYNNGESIAIYYDGEIVSAPNVEAAITDGQAVINQIGTFEEAQTLASTIRIGGLKVELEELRSNVVGAQLGQNAIKTSLIAGAIGLALVIIFMIFVYLVPGVISGIALLIYVGLDLLMLNAFDLTLTLPGIAGIILSIGMAVDANVIIYARIREEITAGKSTKSAIQAGFQKAMSAIIDGNITTLLAAAVLGILGTGSIRGFAMTLALGIVLSMFTALVISRFLVKAFYAVGIRSEKLYARQKKVKIRDFVGKRKTFFIISLVLIISAPVAMLIHSQVIGDKSLNYSLEFLGGTSTTVQFNEDFSIDDLDSKVKPVIMEVTGDANIQMQKVVGESNQVIIKTRDLNLDERTELTDKLVETFGVNADDVTAESISSTVSSEMRRDAVLAIIVATVFMLLYIWFRFKDIRFASSAVLALVHDVLVVLAFYAIARVSVGNSFIACMLTIVGYSINSTIVVFDRIRENLHTMKNKDNLKDVVNVSISQTLTRSIYTNITTFITIFFLYVLGVASIREFALPIMVGIVCGAYSSVCVTGSLWYVMRTRIGKKKAVKK